MASENPTLDKNLEYIEKYNPELKEKILQTTVLKNKIELIETNLKESNLSYNKIPLHSQEGAQIEAQNKFKEIENNHSSRHVVFGMGLGYLFKECCNKSKGVVFLYEPNLEILRIALELIDFSCELKKQNIFVTSDLESFKHLYNKEYAYKSNLFFLTLNSYKNNIYNEQISDINNRIRVFAKTLDINVRGIVEKGQRPLETVLKNIPYTLNATPLYEFKDIYKDKTALIVSAGPSLDLNIEAIKENRNKVIIFCVGTAVKALMDNRITPDFVNVIENSDSFGHLFDLDFSSINLITEPYTHNSVYKLKTKQTFLFPSKCGVNNYWASVTGIDNSSYKVEGTVSYAALASAKMLGFSRLILVGQDLAYLNNQCYSKNTRYSGLSFNIESDIAKFSITDRKSYVNSFKSIDDNMTQEDIEKLADSTLQEIVNSLCFIKGINGEMLPSLNGSATFIEFFNEFANKNKELELINTSMIGAQINGFKNIPLKETLKNLPSVNKIDLITEFKYDKGKIIKKLEYDAGLLQEALSYFIKAKEYIYNYEKEFKRNRKITPESIKNLQSLLSLYEAISSENINYLYKTIAYDEDIEVIFIIGEMNELGLDGISDCFRILKQYYKNVEKKLINIIEKINSLNIILKKETHI